jgi:hypothetical protein
MSFLLGLYLVQFLNSNHPHFCWFNYAYSWMAGSEREKSRVMMHDMMTTVVIAHVCG